MTVTRSDATAQDDMFAWLMALCFFGLVIAIIGGFLSASAIWGPVYVDGPMSNSSRYMVEPMNMRALIVPSVFFFLFGLAAFVGSGASLVREMLKKSEDTNKSE